MDVRWDGKVRGCGMGTGKEKGGLGNERVGIAREWVLGNGSLTHGKERNDVE